MTSPMTTPIVPSRYHTLGSCLNTSALTRMENPMIPPTKELNAVKRQQSSYYSVGLLLGLLCEKSLSVVVRDFASVSGM